MCFPLGSAARVPRVTPRHSRRPTLIAGQQTALLSRRRDDTEHFLRAVKEAQGSVRTGESPGLPARGT